MKNIEINVNSFRFIENEKRTIEKIKKGLLWGGIDLKYFCYISRSKVKGLYCQLKESEIIQYQTNNEITATAGLDSGNKISISSLFGIDVKFGVEGRLQYGKIVKNKLNIN